jgi:putative selenate reductase
MHSDRFYPIGAVQMLSNIINQYNSTSSVFGIHSSLFFQPKLDDAFRTRRFGQLLETPIGVAAGPHTQLSQNIIAAWLTGARFIELKTVQTLDELEVSKPCIDMYDEGYNCEWSQELKIQHSFSQYVDAWVILHVLKDFLGIGESDTPGFIFNMSVGYNFEGIQNENVQWFFNKMANAQTDIDERVEAIAKIYPRVKEIKIGSAISNNITLSTMHGCPPDEVEKIGRYLITEKGLHTTIKLNPTLLGRDMVWVILEKNGFPTLVPEEAFGHDLKFPDAIGIINNLRSLAKNKGVYFGVKLTNTLESVNNRSTFPENEKMMYMSGRALHPISVNLAEKLLLEFKGHLDVSFSAGANAENIVDIIACGLSPVTVCTDLLKPGGYGRLSQYITNLTEAAKKLQANSFEDYSKLYASQSSSGLSGRYLANISKYAQDVLESGKYKRESFVDPSIKTERQLGFFDCIHAPCEDTCPTNQDIPTYNYFASKGDFKSAGEVILQTNPFPQTTGMICDHLCQTKCTRINYDKPVLIREIKRFVAENAIAPGNATNRKPIKQANSKKAAIIGAGPSGLSCAYFLAMAGFEVSVYESKPAPGGMISGVIPPFRLTDEAIANDVNRVEALGVKVNYGVEANAEVFNRLKGENQYVYIAAGAQNSAKLRIDGFESEGVVDPLKLLEDVKSGKNPQIGKHVAIIGGGNTAMDVARTAFRLVGNDGHVTVVYRRTIKEMPADMGEIKAVLEEGVEVMELTAPEGIIVKNGKTVALTCSRMELGERDASGRRSPVRIPNSEFEIEVDTIIPAVGQELAYDFGDNTLLCSKPGTYETQVPNVYLGGDALRGASTAINAIGDGRKVAQIIIDKEGIEFDTKPQNTKEHHDWEWHITKRSQIVRPVKVKETPINDRRNFNLVSSPLTETEVVAEAQRCLLCNEVCSICTTVCPNLANFTYNVEPVTLIVQKAIKKANGEVDIKANGFFEVAQAYQILNIANFCNECGNCNTFCPSNSAPYKEKPKVFLTKATFDMASEGYYLNGKNLLCKQNGETSQLTSNDNDFVFESSAVTATLSKETLAVTNVEFKNGEASEFSTLQAAIMSIIMKGAEQLVYE